MTKEIFGQKRIEMLIDIVRTECAELRNHEGSVLSELRSKIKSEFEARSECVVVMRRLNSLSDKMSKLLEESNKQRDILKGLFNSDDINKETLKRMVNTHDDTVAIERGSYKELALCAHIGEAKLIMKEAAKDLNYLRNKLDAVT